MPLISPLMPVPQSPIRLHILFILYKLGDHYLVNGHKKNSICNLVYCCALAVRRKALHSINMGV